MYKPASFLDLVGPCMASPVRPPGSQNGLEGIDSSRIYQSLETPLALSGSSNFTHINGYCLAKASLYSCSARYSNMYRKKQDGKKAN